MMYKIENGRELSTIVLQQKGYELVLTAEGKLSRKKTSG